MKEISQTYSEFEEKYFEGNSAFKVIIYYPILKNESSELGKSNLLRNCQNLYRPCGFGKKLGKLGLCFLS